MKELAYRELLKLGYSEAEARETVDTASPEDLAALIPANAKPQKEPPKAKPRAKPRAVSKPKITPVPKAKETTAKPTGDKPFDPIAAAMGIVKKAEERPTVRYMVRPLFKLKLVDEVDEATFKGIAEEMKAIGGYWFEPLKCFIFERDPESALNM